MSIIVNQLSYIHPNRELLFENISLTLEKGQKASLVGKNGSGKTTFLAILAGIQTPSTGDFVTESKSYYVPQHFGQYDSLSVAEALGISHKTEALHAILSGDVTAHNLSVLDDDWTIEDRAMHVLDSWGLGDLKLSESMSSLSGGEKTKVFLAGIDIHVPSVILMDEPSNHLDAGYRQRLYDQISNNRATILVVSHDRNLLNQIGKTYELLPDRAELYGGNYEFYKQQKSEKLEALREQLNEKEKQLKQAKKLAREAAERKQRQDVRGAKKQQKAGTPRIMMGMMKNKAEVSSSKLKEVHAVKQAGIATDLTQLRKKLGQSITLKVDVNDATLHRGKILVSAKDVNFDYTGSLLWQCPLNFEIRSGDRIVIEGANGTGKSTLLKLITGQSEPTKGIFTRADFNYQFIDQEYSLIDNSITVFEQVETFNRRNLPEHELKMLLNRYLFQKDTWDKLCGKLSGGEKMKLIFCCMMVSNNSPDIFILDEPTNNLDIDSLEIITSALKEYKGTLLIVSHDRYFIDEIGVNTIIKLD